MIVEAIGRHGTTFVRRMTLEPGETTPWHVDPFHRVTVIVHGDALAIEYRDGSESERLDMRAGQVDWDAPTERVHRASNAGTATYEEVTIFFLDRADAVPQPTVE